MIRLLAVDPGPVPGWALFNRNQITSYGQMPMEEFPEWLENIDTPEHIVYEKYRVFGHKAKAHIGSDVPTLQNVGHLTSYASRHKVPMTFQYPDILPVAERWSGMKLPSNHAQSHQYSALNHGYYYLVAHHNMPTALEVADRAKRT